VTLIQKLFLKYIKKVQKIEKQYNKDITSFLTKHPVAKQEQEYKWDIK